MIFRTILHSLLHLIKLSLIKDILDKLFATFLSIYILGRLNTIFKLFDKLKNQCVSSTAEEHKCQTVVGKSLLAFEELLSLCIGLLFEIFVKLGGILFEIADFCLFL